jgi:hypothetical protein
MAVVPSSSRWPALPVRPRCRLAAVVTSLVTAVVGSLLATAAPAAADTVTTTQSWTAAGTYTITVPDYVESFTLDGLGGAGFPGDASAGGGSAGGAAGAGSVVHTVIAAAQAGVQPGDVLQVTVGGKGGGGQRGYGSELSGSGGNGGGATTVVDTTRSLVLVVAGGGGGGGGGSANLPGHVGGNGGSAAAGTPGAGGLFGDEGAGRGGQGGLCTEPTLGGAGESAPNSSGVAGGGGGGAGVCGGQGGGSGDHGAGLGGGGGGGAGSSSAVGTASFTAGTNGGDGSVTVDFTTTALHAPVISVQPCIYLTNADTPHMITSLTATGFPLPTLTLSGAPEGMVLIPRVSEDPDSSAFILANLSAVPPGSYRFAVEASSAAGSVVQPLSIETGETGQVPAFLSPASATVQAGTQFQFQTSVIGCPPPASYALVGAPDWLSIGYSGGTLVGTPPAGSAGQYTFSIEARTATGLVLGTQSFTLSVLPLPLAVTSATLPPATAGSPYSTTLAATGGTAPYTWSLAGGSALPAGLNLHADGTIDGTASAAGQSSFTVQVADTGTSAATATTQLSLAVSPAALEVATTSPLPAGTAGTPYSATLAAAGGTAPYAWSLSSGSALPAGLTLHPDGTIDGTPTGPSTTTVGFTLIDSGSPTQTAAASLYLPVQPRPVAAIAVLLPDLPSGRVGVPYSGRLHAAGGSGTLSWSLAAGSTLPVGLTLSPSGAITGTPTVAGSPSVSFLVTDSGGPATASATYPLSIAPATLAVSTSGSLPSATVGSAYRAALAATGGSSPYTWSLARGSSLPKGLTLHRDGTIDGAPTASGSSRVGVVVTDAAARTATARLALTVAPAPRAPDLAVSLTHLGAFRTGQLGTFGVQVSNRGTGPTAGPVTLSVRLASGLTPVMTVSKGWSCTISGSTVSCVHPGAMAARATSLLAVLARVGAPSGSTLASTATVTPTDATPRDDTATDLVRVTPR